MPLLKANSFGIKQTEINIRTNNLSYQLKSKIRKRVKGIKPKSKANRKCREEREKRDWNLKLTIEIYVSPLASRRSFHTFSPFTRNPKVSAKIATLTLSLSLSLLWLCITWWSLNLRQWRFQIPHPFPLSPFAQASSSRNAVVKSDFSTIPSFAFIPLLTRLLRSASNASRNSRLNPPQRSLSLSFSLSHFRSLFSSSFWFSFAS